ncbi:MAG: ParB N-terminal domain-containing protein [Pseudomonadota bacterium]
MAKRKRLAPAALMDALQPGSERAPETKALPNGWAGVRTAPIADVAGASAKQAALEEVAGEMTDARREGRLIQRIALDAIDETYLVRDRAVVDAEEMAALEQSLRVRGQQTPLEVVALGEGRFGLISGWRRLVALRGIEGADDALCLVRAPQTASEAYLAMVEENEIRAGLSFYERARIAARAAEQGAYPTARLAVKGLFGNVSSSKRSKIASFLAIYEALDEVLQYPARLTEKQGLALARALETDARLAARIAMALPEDLERDAEAEQEVLSEALRPVGEAAPSAAPKRVERADEAPQAGITVKRGKGKITLSGADVTEDLMDALEAWLKAR